MVTQPSIASSTVLFVAAHDLSPVFFARQKILALAAKAAAGPYNTCGRRPRHPYSHPHLYAPPPHSPYTHPHTLTDVCESCLTLNNPMAACGRMLSGGSSEYTSVYARFQSSYVVAASHACTLGSNASPAAKGRPLAGVKRLARSQRAPASALRGELEELRKHVAHVLRNAHGRDGARHRHLQVA
jgi:hypothetical protein